MSDRTAIAVIIGAVACVPLSAVLGIAQWWEVAHATVYGCAAFWVAAIVWAAWMRQKIARRRSR